MIIIKAFLYVILAIAAWGIGILLRTFWPCIASRKETFDHVVRICPWCGRTHMTKGFTHCDCGYYEEDD